MIIPSKFNGFHGGVRRCFGGGGGGGGGGSDGGGDAGGGSGAGGPNDVYAPKYTSNTGNTGFNPNQGSITGMNFNGTGNTAGASNAIQDNSAFRSMGGLPYNQAGQYYNSLLQQGYTGNDIRGALTTQGRPVSDSDYGFLVQNAAMTSPTGRPMAGSDQFFQPVYNTSYQNYARPATQFNVSSYGTQPSNSPAFNSGMSRNAINQNLNSFYQDNYRDNPMGASMSDTLNFMRNSGINRDDFQTWGGVNNYGPQMSFPQMQSPFNPYASSYGGYGGFMPQMQSPFSYQQPSYGGYGGMGGYGGYDGYGMQSPFSYQQPATRYAGSGFSRGVRRAEGGIASLMDDAE